MHKSRWTATALRDLQHAVEYIAEENPDAAHGVASRIWDASKRLEAHPNIGRPGRVAGTREWAISGTPYLIAYRLTGDYLELLRILHGRQKWPSTL